MAQLLFFTPYIAAAVLGWTASGFLWALALVVFSVPFYQLMRLEGRRRYGMPVEDWSALGLAIHVATQWVILGGTYWIFRGISALVAEIGLG